MWNWLLFDIKSSNFPSENDQSSYKSKNTLASIFFQSQKKKAVNPILPGGGGGGEGGWGKIRLLFFLNLAPKKSEKSAICKDIELKFAIETNFGPLSLETNINLQFDVIKTSL